jgi:hypothetical protein
MDAIGDIEVHACDIFDAIGDIEVDVCDIFGAIGDIDVYAFGTSDAIEERRSPRV